jgi:hypothetical protein
MGLGAVVWIVVGAIGAPAVLALWLVRLMRGRLEGELLANPTGIAIGLSLIGAVSALAALEPRLQAEIGPWVVYTGGYAVVSFCAGLLVGWAEARGQTKGLPTTNVGRLKK